MPIFEYRCRHCSTEFERIVFKENEAIACPSCGQEDSQRLLSTFAVSSGEDRSAAPDGGPCGCGAPRPGMCGLN